MQADYVVVGAGSAGCAVAARLAASGRTVVLLEAGERRDGLRLRMPAAAGTLPGDRDYDQPLRSEPDPTLGARRSTWANARVLGGGSAIDGLVHAYGRAADYDEWARQGASGWAWADVAPCLRALEDFADDADAARGRGGPLPVQRVRGEPLADAFLAACAQAGVATLADVNGARGAGAGLVQATLRDGRRVSAADAFLAPLKRDPHLTLLTGTRVLRLQMDGRRCIGVFARDRGRELQVRARAGVVLACGAFGSPKLLLQAGVGPPGILEAAGVRVLHALAGVGANLSDHVAVAVAAHARAATLTRASVAGPGSLFARARWLADRSGPLARPAVVALAHLRSQPALAEPDLMLQFHASPFDPEAPARLGTRPGYATVVHVRRPRARGRVRLASADPDAPLRVEHLALIDREEVARLVAGVGYARALHASEAFARWRDAELAPGAAVTGSDALEAWVRAHAFVLCAPAGTCRMGAADDADAVVDPRLRVRGVRGLTIADASVMPFAPGPHANAPAMLIGLRAADFLLADERSSA